MCDNFSIMKLFNRDNIYLFHGDAMELYEKWPQPMAIISDGPYGLKSFPGDPPTPDSLDTWYLPHIKAWSKCALPATTLWFWNTELGWANVHRTLQNEGWEFRNCHIWEKGIAHIAGNSNSKTLRKFPVITEVCVQYVKKAFFAIEGKQLTMQEWLRHEWTRTRLPFHLTNQACGVKNAATRKYFTPDHLWYFPPVEAFVAIADFANRHGNQDGKPYFSIDGKRPISPVLWSKMRAKFNFENGITNVWSEPAVRGSERLKADNKCIHMNQKPLRLLELSIKSSTDEGDIIWEPFGGLCSAGIASHRLNRKCYSAEINREFYKLATQRLENYDQKGQSASKRGSSCKSSSFTAVPGRKRSHSSPSLPFSD